MDDKITINFGNIIEELNRQNLKICFVKNKGLFIEDNQNRLYQMELNRQGSYLDRLIRNKIVVEFNLIKSSVSKKIKNYDKEIWGVSEVEEFIKRQIW